MRVGEMRVGEMRRHPGSPYISTQRAAGLTYTNLNYRRAWGQAALPILTLRWLHYTDRLVMVQCQSNVHHSDTDRITTM